MTEVVPHRAGSLFYHRDTRLRGKVKHPLIIKSADITAHCLRRQNTVRLDYGYGGDKRLYVEVAIYKPRPGTPWVYHLFEVQALIDGRRPETLAEAARLLKIAENDLVTHIVHHALN